MSVYIEVVLFNNFFLDMMLLYATVTVRRRKLKFWRAIISALIGTICATAYAVLPMWTRLVMQALLAPAMCAICMGGVGKNAKRKLGDFVGSTLIFMFLTYFAGGAVYGISFAIGVDIKSYAVLGLMAIAVIALILSVKLIAHTRSASTNATRQTTIKVGLQTVNVNALCDSGNLLVDDVSGLPIVILSQEVEEKLRVDKPSGFVNIDTVSGSDSLALVDIDAINVDGKQFRALGALSHKSFDGFDIILQNSMF